LEKSISKSFKIKLLKDFLPFLTDFFAKQIP